MKKKIKKLDDYNLKVNCPFCKRKIYFDIKHAAKMLSKLK